MHVLFKYFNQNTYQCNNFNWLLIPEIPCFFFYKEFDWAPTNFILWFPKNVAFIYSFFPNVAFIYSFFHLFILFFSLTLFRYPESDVGARQRSGGEAVRDVAAHHDAGHHVTLQQGCQHFGVSHEWVGNRGGKVGKGSAVVWSQDGEGTCTKRTMPLSGKNLSNRNK